MAYEMLQNILDQDERVYKIRLNTGSCLFVSVVFVVCFHFYIFFLPLSNIHSFH